MKYLKYLRRCSLDKMFKIRYCPIPDLLSKSLRGNYRAKKSMTKKKRNYCKLAQSSPTRSRQFFTRYTVPSKNALFCLKLTSSTNDASDRFMRDTIINCNSSEMFVLLDNTMQN